jgi:hypothetical protein
MGIILRSAAPAALALATCMAAEAAFVYSSASRSTAVSLGSTVVDSESTVALGDWFGSASTSGSTYSSLATQGSRLANIEMSFVGAAQAEGSSTAPLAAASLVDVFFTVDLSESISWIAGLSSSAGSGASISLIVSDLTAGSNVLVFTGPTNGSGTFSVVAGRSYRLQIAATATTAAQGSGLASYNANFQSTIPAPASILALAGMFGLSRRRR